MVVNLVLGIRYFFTCHTLVGILLSVIVSVNIFVNVVLGVRYFFTYHSIQLHIKYGFYFTLTDSLHFGVYDCRTFIRNTQ